MNVFIKKALESNNPFIRASAKNGREFRGLSRTREGKIIGVFLAIRRRLPPEVAKYLDEKMLKEIITEFTGKMPKNLRSIEELELGPFVEDALGTSKAAAINGYPNANTQRHRVLLEVARAGEHGLTRDEISLGEYTGKSMSKDAVHARVWELGPRGGGWIEPNGKVRKTPMGQDAEVLVLTKKGAREVRDHE